MRTWLLAGLVGLSGCFVQVEAPPSQTAGGDTDADPCAEVACSVEGYCEQGECFCNPDFVGNPNALYGCQPSQASAAACQTTCGLNAYCDDGVACVCADGFVAVCGTGDCMPIEQVCDGIEDCVNERDEDPEVCEVAEVQQWTLIDGCDDGIDVSWRLWARDRGWVWPSLEEVFFSEGPDVVSRTTIECVRGETICLGAQAGDVEWGIGAFGNGTCDDCCKPCLPGVIEFGTLACP